MSAGGMVMDRLELGDSQLDSFLGQVSPLVKLGVAIAWLLGMAFTLAIAPPVVLALVALVAGLLVGGIPAGTLLRSLAPLALAAVAIGVSNVVFAAVNTDPDATELFQIGPLRVTLEAVVGALGLMARVAAIACVGAVFALTTDATRLADSLVQQATMSPRFAYGALAAYQAIPRFGQDLTTLRQARRIRGLRGSWHPRLLVGVLVLAIRHADRTALAMDARALGMGPRTRFREVRWTWRDPVTAVVAVAVLYVALRFA